MKCYCAKTAPAVASTISRNAELYLFYRLDTSALFIYGMIIPHIRKLVNSVKLLCRKRLLRYVLNKIPIAVLLRKSFTDIWIMFIILLSARFGIRSLTLRTFFKARKNKTVCRSVLRYITCAGYGAYLMNGYSAL